MKINPITSKKCWQFKFLETLEKLQINISKVANQLFKTMLDINISNTRLAETHNDTSTTM